MLEKIKNDFDFGLSAYPPFVNLTEEQVEWLIKQAERAERLEDTNRSLRKMIELGLTFEDVYDTNDDTNPHCR